MGLYYCLDFIGTLTEALFLYTFNHCFLKQPRFTTPICKWITPTMLFALSWLLTWFSELGAYKTIFLIACIFIVLKLCYKDSIYQMLTAMEIWFMSVCLFPEAMGMAVATWIYGDGMIILVEGQKILRWEVYIVIFLIRLTAAFVSYQLVKNIRYKIQLKDCFTLTFTFLIGFSIYILVNYNYLNLSRVVDIIVAFTVLQVSYKESIYQTVIAIEIWFICCIFLVEAFVYPVSKFIFNNMLLVVIDGQNILRWEVYVIAIAIRIVSLIIIYEVLKNFKYKIKANDCAVLSTVFMIGFAALMFSVYNVLNLSKIPHILIFFSLTIFILIFLIVFLYSKNTMFLREQEQKDKMQIAQLQQQFAYYQEKLKDEEKVRSVYHDMKNHLLVLQRQINSPETAEMVEKLQSQVAMYGDYEHTGNDILDIILKEKSETAREKHIALSVTADLNGVDFIEPLDVSTIFGNGLDNAIEASEKLPEEQRAILVKAGRVQNFFSVLIENSCLQNREYTKQRTTKSDDFLHGFGISNMRKAAEKYDGQLTIKCENEKFTLKILIPIP